MTSTFRALEASETKEKFSLSIVEKELVDLPEGELLIKVDLLRVIPAE